MSGFSDLRQAVGFAISIERLGAGHYRRLAWKFEEDAEIAAIFAQLASDEEIHEKQLDTLYETVPQESSTPQAGQTALLLWSMSPTDFFSDKSKLEQHLRRIKTREDALDHALDLEKATLGFYMALKEEIGQSEVLEAVIGMEKKHIIQLMQYMITGAQMRGLEDRYPESRPT